MEKNSSAMRILVQVSLAAIILALGGFGYYKFKQRPKSKRKKPPSLTPMVKVQDLKKKDHPVVLEAFGSIISDRKATVAAQVGGRITSLHPSFTEGGVVKLGETLVEIDDADYQITLQQRKAALITAEAELSLEQGEQLVAKRDWDVLGHKLGKGTASDLALRKPQLKAKEAKVMMAKSQLEQAELDVARTKVTAPFTGWVESKHIEVGDVINAGASLGTLVGTERYRVQVSVPVSALKWLTVPEKPTGKGSKATVFTSDGSDHEGFISALLGGLESEGRMARVMVTIEQPLGGDDEGPILLGDFVKVKLNGPVVKEAMAIPRTALRQGNVIWLLRPDNTLTTHTVDVVWEERETVIIRDSIELGERLIVSDLGFPVEGMTLLVFGEKAMTPPPTSTSPVDKPEGADK